MHRALFSLTLRRGLWLVTCIGLATFAATLGALVMFARGWAAKRMREIDNYASAVAASVQQQNAATGEISQNVAGAADGARLIVNVLRDVADATTDSQQSAQTVLTASESVEEAASRLRGAVETFLTKVAV